MPDAASQPALPLVPAAGAPQPDCPHGWLGRVPVPRPRVISASKRTDIPAFYLAWLRERCRTGWVDVPNPLYRHAADPLKRLTHVSLRPEHVLAIVWWSKNYAVYLRQHAAFGSYRAQYFQFTINSRRADLAWLEPDVPPLPEALRQMRALAVLHGPERIAWRYDPLVFWWCAGRADSSWDPTFFEQTCRAVAALGVLRAIVSVADPYRKFVQRLRRYHPDITLREPTPAELDAVAAHLRQVAAHYGLTLLSCAEPLLAARGIPGGACIDGALLGALARTRVSTAAATDSRLPGRESCACTLHTDIGDYVSQPCGYACQYCYANPSEPDRDARRR